MLLLGEVVKVRTGKEMRWLRNETDEDQETDRDKTQDGYIIALLCMYC